jgi:DUF4097 and DUF4098 domain-containing protein YvlB
MKRSLILLIFCVAASQLLGQKLVEKTISCGKADKVSMNLKITDSINIHTWNKNEVYVKATVNIDDNSQNDKFSIHSSSADNEINIETDISDLKLHRSITITQTDTTVTDCVKQEIFIEVFVPESMELRLETINGNITLTGNGKALFVKTISGFIDVSLAKRSKTNLELSTLSGIIYSNSKMEILKTSKNEAFQKVKSIWNGGGANVHLESISGDIYLREI